MAQDEEVIVPIPGHPLYGATRSGRIFSMRRSGGFCRGKVYPWREMKQSPCTGGNYRMFTIGGGRKMMVHKAIAITFIGPVPKGNHVAHIDGNSHHNHAGNLAIVTPKENNAHKRLHGTHREGDNHASAKLNSMRVFVIRTLLKRRAVRARRLAHLYGVSESTISMAKDTKRWGVWKTREY